MTSRRRSTRAAKAPERFGSGSGPERATPRKRSKPSAGGQPSAFATPASAAGKRQKTRKGSATASRRREADEDADSEVVEDSENEREAAQPSNSDVDDTSDQEDEEEEEENAISEASSSEDDDETSDFEERTRAAANRAPRKTPHKGRSKQQSQQPLSARKAKARAVANVEAQTAGENDSHLLGAILDDRVALAQVAMDWIDSYREETDEAVCELVNFFIKLAGCPSRIREDVLYEAESVPAVLVELQKQSIAALKSGGGDGGGAAGVEINGGDDLLMGKSKEYRRFRKNALLFISKLIIDGQHHLIFDEVNEENGLSSFVEVLLQWLVNMASSSYRPFRHVAALVSLAIQSALVSIRARISIEQQTTHRQLEAEVKRGSTKSRRGTNKESAKAEQLRSRVATLTEQDELTEAAFKALYDTVFIYRYRDVHAIIRAECLVPLASWCRAYPASYLDTEYLRYLGWALNDKDPRVREAALSAISGPLLTGKPSSMAQGSVGSGVGAIGGVDAVPEESIAEGVRPFVVRFLPRLVQVAAGDVDTKVQVAALKLISLLGKHDYLDPSARIGDIRFVKKPARSGKSADNSKSKHSKTAKKRRDRSRNTYSHSLSQQMLEESSSDDESDDEGEKDTSAEGDSDDRLEPGAINIQTLYDAEPGSDGDYAEDMHGVDNASSNLLPCPRHSVMRYLSPLVAHTHATVRAAASELAAWWLKEDWVTSARVAAFGVDTTLDGSTHGFDGEEAEPNGESDDAADEVDMEGDASASISDILASPARRGRAKKWLLYKSLGAFLWRLARTDRAPPGKAPAREDDGDMSTDSEPKQQWVLEQAASCIEEMWSAPALSMGLSLGEDSSSTLAGATVGAVSPTALDAEIEACVGSDQGAVLPRSVAAAQALWHKLPELSDLDTLSAFLAWDHSASAGASASSTTAQHRFALAPAEETALVQAYAVWVLERNKAIADKAKRTRNKKDKADLEDELKSLSKLWQSMLVPLLVRNIDSPARLLPLVYIAAEALDLQVMFDAHKTDVLLDIIKNISLVLERYGSNVPLARLATSFLERVDASKILRSTSEVAADSGDSASGGTLPGTLICKAARATAASLATAVASVPETPRAHASAYSDVYARVVVLRSTIRSKDISAFLSCGSLATSETLEAVEERADLSERSPDAAIEQLYTLIGAAAKCQGSQTIPEKAAIATLDTAYYFLLWRALTFDRLLKQHAAYPYLPAEDTEQPPYWKRVESAAKHLKHDRDALLSLCLELADPLAPTYRRLRELAFAVLGRVCKLFTGSLTRPPHASVESAGARHALELRRALILQNGHAAQQQLTKFFERKLADWAYLVAYLSASRSSADGGVAAGESLPEDLLRVAPWYKDAPSSWSTAYSRFCTLAALWAQWIADLIVPTSQLSRLAAYTGMLGLEPLEKQRVESALDSSDHGDAAAKTAPKRKVGFVPLSAFDHIVQAAIDNLKPRLVLQTTRNAVMDAYMAAMRASFEKYLSPNSHIEPPSDAVNVATLARFIVSALRTAFAQQTNVPATPGRARRGGADSTAFILAPAVVGGAWVKHHTEAISYGLSRAVPESLVSDRHTVSMNILGDDGDVVDDKQDEDPVSRDPASAEEWETRVAPWFVALSQTVSGVLRPRHAETLNQHLERLLSKLSLIRSRSSDGGDENDDDDDNRNAGMQPAEDAEHALAAIAPYQRALDKELSKLGAIKARMAEVRAAGTSAIIEPGSDTQQLLSSPPGSPTPAAMTAKSLLATSGDDAGADMEVD
ncbi:hypothetical protein GQ54DRAFT_130939 [Martensiomyces pterosporus]|nr:hypothetical protein GQ54DRAFT_130939 [Martensiomyces pterosporus]